jgi:hypothetical protein
MNLFLIEKSSCAVDSEFLFYFSFSVALVIILKYNRIMKSIMEID